MKEVYNFNYGTIVQTAAKCKMRNVYIDLNILAIYIEGDKKKIQMPSKTSYGSRGDATLLKTFRLARFSTCNGRL